MTTLLPWLNPFFLARRNMAARRGRTALTVLGIVLGVAVVLAIQITNQSTLDSLRQVFDRAAGQANLLVVPAGESSEPLDEDLLPRLADAPGVQVAAPALSVRTLRASQAQSWQVAFNMNGMAAGNMLLLYGIDPQLDSQVRVYELSAGRMPEPGAYEAVLPETLAAEDSLQVGDNLALLTPGGTVHLMITGLLAGEGVALLNDGVVAFTPFDVVQDLFDRGHELDEIALRVDQAIAENPTALEKLKNDLAAQLQRRNRGETEVIYPASRGQLVSQMLSSYQMGLAFFSVIAIFVGTFLIYNTFSMTVVERTREIGMLRALGMSRMGIILMVLTEAGLLALVGSAIGIGVGILLARGLIVLLGSVLTNGESVLSVPWEGLVQSVGVGLGVTFCAALIPAIQAARISPLEALRVRSRTSERIRPSIWIAGLGLLFVGWVAMYHLEWRDEVIFAIGNLSSFAVFLGATLTVALAVTWLERLTRPLANLLYGNEGGLGSSNVRRSVGRTTLTVASLMVALTMIISIGSMSHSFMEDVSGWIDNAMGGDLYVRAPLPMRESFAAQLASVPGVAAITPTRVVSVRAAPGVLPPGPETNHIFYFNAIDPASYRQIGDMEFAAGQGDPEANWQRVIAGEAVFISNVVADRYNLHQGAKLVLLTNRGEHAFYIAGEVMDFTGQGQMLYGTYSDLQRWFGGSGVDRFTIQVANGYSPPAVADEIEARYQARRHVSVQTTAAFKTSILDLMDQSFKLFDVLSLIGVIIGALGVINTLTMNVLERQREIGGLRSLGMTRGQVLRMVLAEALAMGAMGGIYGLGMGYLFGQVLILGMNMMTGYDLVYLFTPGPFLISIAIALGVVQLAALYPARRAARTNIVEAIKHE